MTHRKSTKPVSVSSRAVSHAPSFDARAFLTAHWIHLILFLAMLLIVVGTTVGAYYILGQTLLQPAPKAGLGLFYILAFWILGELFTGLGAPSAGRVTLAATLVLIPINFMVARDLVLHLDLNAALYAIVLIALIAVAIRVLPVVLQTTGTKYFAVTFCGLCAMNAFVQPDMPFRPGFALFLIAS